MGGVGTQQSFSRGAGSAPRSVPSPVLIPCLTEKGTPYTNHPLKNADSLPVIIYLNFGTERVTWVMRSEGEKITPLFFLCPFPRHPIHLNLNPIFSCPENTQIATGYDSVKNGPPSIVPLNWSVNWIKRLNGKSFCHFHVASNQLCKFCLVEVEGTIFINVQ